MAKDYTIMVDGHPNIYNGYSPRQLKIYFSEPDSGINEATGMLLFLPAYGGNASSNVYKKMRSQFADQYNLVTVQCDYFGWEFMQYDHLQESPENFNDMGLMQALDHITAVIVVSEIIKDNDLTFNTGKIMAFGASHGAYLAYLCNVFAPGLFSLIVECSAYVLPVFLKLNRVVSWPDGMRLIFHYEARNLIRDYDILDLNYLYGRFKNESTIHSFHGIHDKLITFEEKQAFCRQVERLHFHPVGPEQLDGHLFKSAGHDMGVHFIHLLDYVFAFPNHNFATCDKLLITSHEISTKLGKYSFDYSSIVPVLLVH